MLFIPQKAAKAANIARYRPEAIWQPWQCWQCWQPCGGSILDFEAFMRTAGRLESPQAVTRCRNSLGHRTLEVVRGDHFPNSLSAKVYDQF